MPRTTYVGRNFRQESLDRIVICNQIIEDYLDQGYSLTLRQLYYRLVAQGHIPNTKREYKNIGALVSNARLAGLIDWQAIEDRTRVLRSNSHWDGPKEIIRSARHSFMLDRWRNQLFRFEVWVEKDALIGIVGQVCRELDVPYFSCRGYTSQSEMWRASNRLYDWMLGEENFDNSPQAPIIIHLADHDPSGIDMTRDITDRLEVFWADDVEVQRIALNMDQIEQYSPPPYPAKVTDSRFTSYVIQFGDGAWELDALEPQVLADLIRDTILGYRDEELWAETVEIENSMIRQLEVIEASLD